MEMVKIGRSHSAPKEGLHGEEDCVFSHLQVKVYDYQQQHLQVMDGDTLGII